MNNRFFYPAGEILYKNHGCVLEAAEILKSRGINDFSVSFTLNKGDIPYLSRYPEHEQVKYLGRIPREEVFERYKKEILLFPSYIETFGYPPAEARAVGGRILASDCPFCHEALSGYKDALYFDPFDPKELAELMERTIRGELFEGSPASVDTGTGEPSGSINIADHRTDSECVETDDMQDGNRNSWAGVVDVIVSDIRQAAQD